MPDVVEASFAEDEPATDDGTNSGAFTHSSATRAFSLTCFVVVEVELFELCCPGEGLSTKFAFTELLSVVSAL